MNSDLSALQLRLIREVLELPRDRLLQLESWLTCHVTDIARGKSKSGVEPPQSKGGQSRVDTGFQYWPHAPLHRISEHGTFFVTTGTLHKQHVFADNSRRDELQSRLLELATEHGWKLEAWAVFANHYHFVGSSREGSSPLNTFLGHLHTDTATTVNQLDGLPERQVWHNFRETQLTFEKSYLARLNYVHQNAVHHGLVAVANQYPWCSAAWFERSATRAQVATIYSFKTDRVQVYDDFEV